MNLVSYSRHLIIAFALCGVVSCANQNNEAKFYDYPEIILEQDFSKITRPSYESVLKIIEKNTLVGSSWIDSPLNQVVLIKGEGAKCAVKFTHYSRKNDRKPVTVFSSGEESLFAEYDFWELKSKDRHEGGIKPQITHEKLDSVATVGIGRLSIQPGNRLIWCGDSKILWRFPTGVMIFGIDKHTFFATTNLTNIEDVNFNDKNIVWYGYQDDREMIQIPVMTK